MDVIDPGVLGEGSADLAASLHDAQQPERDERRQGAAEHRNKRVLCRVDLEDADPVVGDELVEDVEYRDRGDVACAQD